MQRQNGQQSKASHFEVLQGEVYICKRCEPVVEAAWSIRYVIAQAHRDGVEGKRAEMLRQRYHRIDQSPLRPITARSAGKGEAH